MIVVVDLSNRVHDNCTSVISVEVFVQIKLHVKLDFTASHPVSTFPLKLYMRARLH